MIKKFTLEVEFNTCTDHLKVNTNNEGFHALELLGLFELKKQDVMNQIYNPNDFDRKGNQVVYKGDD